nr:MAG TPA: hypothetical protein [Caudoviricetes sp.]
MMNKNDNKIESDKEFKVMLHSKMKEIHGDKYNPEVTERVANGLIERYNGNYPAMVKAAFSNSETRTQSKLKLKTRLFADSPSLGKWMAASIAVGVATPIITQLGLYALDFYLNKHKTLKDLKEQDTEEVVKDFLRSNRGVRASEDSIRNASESMKDFLHYQVNKKYAPYKDKQDILNDQIAGKTNYKINQRYVR